MCFFCALYLSQRIQCKLRLPRVCVVVLLLHLANVTVRSASCAFNSMFSYLKQVHSASFVSYCLVRLLFMFDILFMAAVRVDIDSTMFFICSGVCRHEVHGQTPTGSAFFSPTQSV